MTELHLRARSVTELVDAAFSLYRRNAMDYIVLSAICMLPLLFFQLVVQGPEAAIRPSLDWTAFGSFAVSIVTYGLVAATVILMGSRSYLGEPTDVAATVREVLPRVPAVIVVTILRFLLYTAYVFLFLIGVLYAAARWFGVTPAVVLEGKNPWAALGRSSELSSGRKGHILKTLALIWVIYFLMFFGATALAAVTGSAIVRVLVNIMIGVIANPIIALVEMVLYYDARIRSEGFDLEQMAGALDSRPAT